MDLRKLKTLIDLVSESNISELEITEAEGKVRIVKEGLRVAAVPVSSTPAPVAAPVQQAPATETPAAAGADAATAPGKVVKSPMVGTYYRAASPGAKPFVEVGDTIKAGDAVCIIEAMKVMNEIKAEKSGTICALVAEDGTPVQFGDVLFRIK